MDTYDWSAFTLRININVDVSEVYNAWSKAASLEKWFLRNAEFQTSNADQRDKHSVIQPGDTYRWFWYGWSDDVFEKGTILLNNGSNLLQFSFGNAGTVTVSIKEIEDETICELTQIDIPEDAEGKTKFHIGCMQGWTFYLTNLKSFLEGGIDLRNKNEALNGVLNS